MWGGSLGIVLGIVPRAVFRSTFGVVLRALLAFQLVRDDIQHITGELLPEPFRLTLGDGGVLNCSRRSSRCSLISSSMPANSHGGFHEVSHKGLCLHEPPL